MKQFLRNLGLFLGVLALLLLSPAMAAAAPTQQTTTSATFDQIQERGYLIVGVKFDAPPFGFVNEAGEVRGFEIELMREFARRWLGDASKIEFVQVTSGNRIERLLSGDIDLIAATMTITAERDEKIDFSRVYFLDGQNILVNAVLRPIDASDDVLIQALDANIIAAVEGSTSIKRIVEFAESQGITITVAGFEQYDQAIQPLRDGRIDGLTTDRGILQGLAAEHKELAILLDQNFSEEPYGLGIRPGDEDFVALINETLLAMKADGTYDAIYTAAFADQPPFALDTYPATGAAQPAATPTQTATTAAATPTAIPPTEEPTVAPTTTPTLVPTATPSPALTPSPLVTPAVDLLPSSGASLRSFDQVPAVLLLIALLFISAVYRKQRTSNKGV